jgi:tetratricopeptide (TPR) repeat protein
MATTTDSYTAARLDELEPGPSFTPQGPDLRDRLDVRQHFGITAFGIQAFRALEADELIREHDEAGLGASRQEELYLVLNGAATFIVDGEEVEAPSGTAVFVRPEAKRSAVAKEVGTTVLVVGGTPGEAYVPPIPENAEAFAAYNERDYETAVEKQRIVAEQRPGVLAYYNLACFEARAGRTDDAIGHLRHALEADERIRENIRTDEDLDALREDARFRELVS